MGWNALSDVAIQKIFQLKGRPSDNPLIVHLWDRWEIGKYAEIENEIQQKIIDKLMPWPITLLLPKKEWISKYACWVPLVWIRIPSNQIAKDFLNTVKLPIAAPSANISWKPSPTNAKMVYDNMWNKIQMIIDGWESEAGIESTVIRVMNGWILILRPGFVTKEDLESLFEGKVKVEYSQKNPELSPWMKYKHYSIDGKVEIVNNVENIMEWQVIWYLISQEFYDENQIFFSNFKEKDKNLTKIRGSRNNLVELAHALFDYYHWFDRMWVDVLYVEGLEEVWIGYSIMNRVKRSAGLL